MERLAHWTQKSTKDFVYAISSNYVAQLETRMEEKGISKSALAGKLGKTSGRVSQVFNNPGNLGLRVIVEFARSLGMKVGIVAYDDNDPSNINGPINPEVFVESWNSLNRPRDLFELEEHLSGVSQFPGLDWTVAFSAINMSLAPCTGATAGFVDILQGKQMSAKNEAVPEGMFQEEGFKAFREHQGVSMWPMSHVPPQSINQSRVTNLGN